MNMFWNEKSRIEALCNELLYKVGFNQNTVYMTRFDETLPKLTVSYDA
jgi:hypothetical protein